MKRGPTVPAAVRRGSVGSRQTPGAHGDAVRSCMDPYVNREPIRESRAICRAPLGPVVPKQGSDGNLSEPDLARRDLTSPDGLLDCTVSVYD